MAAPVRPSPAFGAGTPRPLFDAPLREYPFQSVQYDVSADGQHFLFAQVAVEETSAQITLVQNWTAGLKR